MNRTELYKNYGEVELVFTSYYKYSFSFVGANEEGAVIIASYGGSADDIYRFEVEANKKYLLKNLEPDYVVVKKDGEDVDKFVEF